MLLGFTGYPSSGKSTAARYLHEKHGFAWINVGDPMKAMLAAFYKDCGLDDKEIDRRLYGDLKRLPDYYLNGKTPTHALQTIGGDWRDLISPSLFADRWGEKIRKYDNAVSDGMRYPEEMPVFKKLGGTLVRIERPGLKEKTGHRAESYKLPADVTIINNGTVEDLHRKVEGLLTGVNRIPMRKRVEAVC